MSAPVTSAPIELHRTGCLSVTGSQCRAFVGHMPSVVRHTPPLTVPRNQVSFVLLETAAAADDHCSFVGGNLSTYEPGPRKAQGAEAMKPPRVSHGKGEPTVDAITNHHTFVRSGSARARAGRLLSLRSRQKRERDLPRASLPTAHVTRHDAVHGRACRALR